MGEPALLETMSAVGPGTLEQYALQQLLAHVGVLIGRHRPHVYARYTDQAGC